jgi:hypothetical protein
MTLFARDKRSDAARHRSKWMPFEKRRSARSQSVRLIASG